MKNKLTLTLLLVVLAFSAIPLHAQTILTNTTLSVAVTSSSATSVVLTSATNVNAPSASDATKATYLYVDRELMDVRAVNGTTISVVRGAAGTLAVPHAASAFVFVIPAYMGTYFNRPAPQGACTRGNELALPRIAPPTGIVSDCLGGQWHNAVITQTTFTQRTKLRYPDPGATALTALETAGTAPSAATEEYCTELYIPEPMVLTGLAVLNGTTVATDKHILILRDSAGKALANSATAGTTTAGASVYQTHAFTAKYFAVAPARYFACMQTNGTTDTVRHAITAVNDNIIGGAVTGQVFGTVAAITPPSTFTTAKAPYFVAY